MPNKDLISVFPQKWGDLVKIGPQQGGPWSRGPLVQNSIKYSKCCNFFVFEDRDVILVSIPMFSGVLFPNIQSKIILG